MKIDHDIHTHTLLSACCHDPAATVEAYVRRAAELGHTVFGISNHLWDEKVEGASTWYKGQMINYGLQARNCVPADTCGVKVKIGVETEYFAVTDTLGMLADTAERFDYILVPHTHVHMKGTVCPDPDDVLARRAEMRRRLAAAMPELSEAQIKKMVATLPASELRELVDAEPTDLALFYSTQMINSFEALMENSEFVKLAARVPTVIAHPMHACCIPHNESVAANHALREEDLRRCFGKAKNLGIGLEVNVGCFNAENDYADEANIRTIRIARDAGCKFTFGTDTHSLKGLGSITKGERISELTGITEADLFTPALA